MFGKYHSCSRGRAIEIRGNTLLAVLALIVVCTLSLGTVLKKSFNQTSVSKQVNNHTIAKYAAQEVLENTKHRVINSIKYFGLLKNTAGNDTAAIDAKFKALYATRYDDFVASLTPSDVPGGFIDFARTGGYRKAEEQLPNHQETILYSFSVRCLKDDTFGPTTVEYLRGDFDGCPVADSQANTNFGRSTWSSIPNANWPLNLTAFDNWIRLPKQIEIVISIRVGDVTTTTREVATAEPVMLNDYAYALGHIPNSDPNNPFRLFGNQFFGRVHFDDVDLTSSAPNSRIYRIIMDANRQSFNFFRPLTSSGVILDAVDSLSSSHFGGPASDPDSFHLHTSGTNTFKFLGGFDAHAPQLHIPDRIDDSFNGLPPTSLAPASGALTPNSVAYFPNNNCSLRVNYLLPPANGTAPFQASENGRINISCAGGGGAPVTRQYNFGNLNNIPTFKFRGNVAVFQSKITSPIAVYAEKNIIFMDSVAYDTSSLGNAHTYVPVLEPNPNPATVVPPLKIGSADNSTHQAINNNSSALALWVTKQDIVIDAARARPMFADGSDANGIQFRMPTDTTTAASNETVLAQSSTSPEVPLIQGNQNAATLQRALILDGKMQAKGTFRLATNGNINTVFTTSDRADDAFFPASCTTTSNTRAPNCVELARRDPPPSTNSSVQNAVSNLGTLILRGGITANGINNLRQTYGTNNHVSGFNTVASWFDSRPQFNKFPGQLPLLGEVNWTTISFETNYEGGLFGDDLQANIGP